MISAVQAFVLGAIQGLTEFLPISSSAHLIIFPWFFAWADPGLAFDVALHLGTLVALLAYYWREWSAMGISVFAGGRQDRHLLLLLVVASVPGAIAGLVLEHQAEGAFREHKLLIALVLGLLGIALWWVDRAREQERTISEMTCLDALAVGLSQAFAVVPGVSRSGATITMGRLIRMRREDAANFSFLMATPIIAGAGLIEARKIVRMGFDRPMVIGFLTAALFGWIAIAILVRFVRARSYAVFAGYRLALAGLVTLVVLARG
jgi:undecaprenyl-diphosphatase